MFFRRPVRQWIILTGLFSGFVGSAIGASFGQPNSWIWFLAGVAAALALIPATRSLRASTTRS